MGFNVVDQDVVSAKLFALNLQYNIVQCSILLPRNPTFFFSVEVTRKSKHIF